MSSYRVLWTDAAIRDLEEIVAFMAADRPKNVLRIFGRLERRCSRIMRLPERGRIVPELKAVEVFGCRELIEPPWRIVYRHDKGRVYVMAVLDSRRNLSSLLLERLAR